MGCPKFIRTNDARPTLTPYDELDIGEDRQYNSFIDLLPHDK